MSSVSCFLSWMSILGLVLAGFLGYGFSSILVLLALSTLIFKFSNQTPWLQVDKILENDFLPTPDQEISPVPVLEDEIITDKKEDQENNDEEEEDKSQIDHEYLMRSSPVILSQSECPGRSSTTSEDSEVNYWQLQDQSPDFSDGSISDEDSLIEIALPSGHYIGSREKEEDQDSKFNSLKKFQDFVPAGSFFKQHGLMELLAELNDMNNIEEENLIEIDISMGSIKCPRFEIEA